MLALRAATHVSAGVATRRYTAPGDTTTKPVKVIITYANGQACANSVAIAKGDTAIQRRRKIAAATDGHAIPN